MPVVTVSNGILVGALQPLSAIGGPVGVSLGGGGDLTKTGSLTHPALGTLNYIYQPSKWSGIDGDIIVFPVYQVEKTLTGRYATVWEGSIEDAVCVEQWPGLPISMSDILRKFYETPTDIEAGQFCVWAPEYCSNNQYNVIIESLEIRAAGPAGDPTLQHGYVQTVHGWDTKEITMLLRIKSRA